VVFELTQSYEFAVASMLAAVIATFFTSLVFGHSFFDEQLLRRGIDLSRGRGDLELQKQPISTVMNDDFVRATAELRVKDAVKKLVKADASEGYCVGENEKFIGKFSLQGLLAAPQLAPLKAHFMAHPVVLNHDASIAQAMEVASNFVGETIPIIHHENGQIIGVVSEADIFGAYLVTQSRMRDLEHN
jgi:CIC family chloride channel protein